MLKKSVHEHSKATVGGADCAEPAATSWRSHSVFGAGRGTPESRDPDVLILAVVCKTTILLVLTFSRFRLGTVSAA
jgi:hypothetical protein